MCCCKIPVPALKRGPDVIANFLCRHAEATDLRFPFSLFGECERSLLDWSVCQGIKGCLSSTSPCFTPIFIFSHSGSLSPPIMHRFIFFTVLSCFCLSVLATPMSDQSLDEQPDSGNVCLPLCSALCPNADNQSSGDMGRRRLSSWFVWGMIWRQ